MWVKLPDEFADEAAGARLSDAAFRLHVEMLCLAMRRLDGGRVSVNDLTRKSEVSSPLRAANELADVGWWDADGDEWRIRQTMDEQITPKQAHAQRERDRERQQRWRNRKLGIEADGEADPWPDT